MARSKQKKRKGRQQKRSRRVPKRDLYEGLDRAGELIEQKRWTEARDVLEPLDRRYPDRPAVLSPLMGAHYELHDLCQCQRVCERLVALCPDDPDLRLMLAGLHLSDGGPALARRQFRHFLRCWPQDERAEEVRQTVEALEAIVPQIATHPQAEGEELFELLAQHEQVVAHLGRGELHEAVRRAVELLGRWPRFVPARNNLADAQFFLGRWQEAMATARSALDIEPDNVPALANLTRHQFLAGQFDEAEATAERLRAAEPDRPDAWAKKAESLSFLGDDEGVLEIAGAVRPNEAEFGPAETALLAHLAAVSAMRLGRKNEARRGWKQALKHVPGFEPARANLDDMELPVGERNGPWARELVFWLPQSICERFVRRLGASCSRREGGADQGVCRLLEEHPFVAALVPALLDRGDPVGREFAVRLAMALRTPELLDALKEFALGQRGPDKLRYRAIEAVRQSEVLPAGPVRMWVAGTWQEVQVLTFEIHEEPKVVHGPKVEPLAARAFDALTAHDGREAERLLQQALEIEPEANDLWNNLAMAYELQGRHEEASRLCHDVHRRDPDYLFGRVQMAKEHIAARRIDAAREMLDPLLKRKRLHATEFLALAGAEIELCLARGERKGAEHWLNLLENACPDRPEVERFRRRVRPRLATRLLQRAIQRVVEM